MAAPRVLSGVLLEALTAWQEQIEAHPISPVAEAAWEKAKSEIAAHDEVFAAQCPEPVFPNAA